jgi:hypothetical protein
MSDAQRREYVLKKFEEVLGRPLSVEGFVSTPFPLERMFGGSSSNRRSSGSKRPSKL